MDLNHDLNLPFPLYPAVSVLNLSLGLPEQQDPVEEQDQRQLQFMQPLTSSSDLNHDQNLSFPLYPTMSVLDLSIGLPKQQDPVEEQDQSQLQFMQPLTSSDPPQNIQPSPPSPHHVTSFELFPNDTNPAQALQLFSPPFQLFGQAIHPPQLNQAGTVPLEAPRRGEQAPLNTGEIIPPYPWATRKPAVIHTIRYLLGNNINVISGQVQCNPCNKTQTLEYSLMEKFSELSKYIKDNKNGMRERAPEIWSTPKLVPCGTCQSGMKPVISKSKQEINWLFLLLGQMLGCCTLEQLKSFCEANSQHRTGAKEFVLYKTYLGLCKQLDPEGTFSL